MSRRYPSERGRPLPLSRTRVLPDESKQRGRQNGGKGIGAAILPMKRVTTVEGRAAGNFNLEGETSGGRDKGQNDDGNETGEDS